jgi:Common central domain of tyrosinase/Polyphenol oxidase middle domain
MKKLFLFSAGLVSALIALFSFTDVKNKGKSATDRQELQVACGPVTPFISNVVSFTPPENPFAVMVRKNIYSLSAAEITSIKNGIAAMKLLPLTDPTSWTYQAAIHGTTLPNNLPSWNSCHQPGAAFFFLAWHRMYCYFFERILRAKSGDPNLTLPYWNYQTNAVLHPDYRNSAASNTLYDGSRNASINSGGSLPASISTSINNALLELLYYDFQLDINGPHGSVHGAVGGNMGSVNSAAKDPVFWLHHCNIDRLWEEWLRKCGGRKNPDDAPWLTKSYTFFDETGTAVSMTGSQVLSTASMLNYRYDFVPVNKFCLVLPLKWLTYKRWYLIKWPLPYEINRQLLKKSFRETNTESLDNFVKSNNKARFSFDKQESPDKLIIEIDRIKADRIPEGVVEVYLNLPANEKPSAKSKSYVGLLDLFEVSHAAAHKNMNMAGMEDGTKLELNASRAAKALGLSIEDLKKAEVSFYVRGNTVKGREVSTASSIRVEGINLAIEIAQ